MNLSALTLVNKARQKVSKTDSANHCKTANAAVLMKINQHLETQSSLLIHQH